MTEPLAILVPLLNPNEPDSRLAALQTANGRHVRAGDTMATLETTKSSVDVVAPQQGFVTGLQAAVGDVLHAGERLCWLAESAAWRPPEEKPASPGDAPVGLRLTEPALALARQAGIDLTRLPVGPLITESAVRGMIFGKPITPPTDLPAPGPILVYGGGGHGKSVIELIRSLSGFEVVAVIDDALAPGAHVLGVPVTGGGDSLTELKGQGVRLAANAVGGIGDVMSRVRVFERLIEAGFAFPALVHPTAFVEASAHLSPGVQVLPHAYVGSDCRLGFGVIVNTSAVVSHDCTLGAYANVAPGALLAGGVTLGEQVLIGMGVTINLGVMIGAGARVGNSAVVKKDVPDRGVVRAGALWPE